MLGRVARSLLLLSVVLANATLFAAAPAQRPRLALLPLTAVNVPAHVPVALEDVLAVEIGNSGRFDVIASSEIKNMLGLEEMKQAIGCDDASCIAEIGGALDVTYVVSGRVSRLGDQMHISLVMSDVTKARVRARALETLKADESLLVEAAARAAHKLILAYLAPATITLAPVGAAAPGAATLSRPPQAPPPGVADAGSPWTAALSGAGLVTTGTCIGGFIGLGISVVAPMWDASSRHADTNAMILSSPGTLLCGLLGGSIGGFFPALLASNFFGVGDTLALSLVPSALGAAIGGGFALVWSVVAASSPNTLADLGMDLDTAYGMLVVFSVPLIVIGSIVGGATYGGMALALGDAEVNENGETGLSSGTQAQP